MSAVPALATHVRGFYAVLDRDDEQLARSLVSASRVLQVRLKDATAIDLTRIARMARKICDEVGAAMIVNDRVDVALLAGADGVHLGQTDLPIADVRELVGPHVWIGVSTHNTLQVERALGSGADYLGFGPVFATGTKQNADPVQGLEGLRAAVVAARGTPIVAIGGITPAQAASVYQAGATAICAISAVTGSQDPSATAARMGRNTT